MQGSLIDRIIALDLHRATAFGGLIARRHQLLAAQADFTAERVWFFVEQRLRRSLEARL